MIKKISFLTVLVLLLSASTDLFAADFTVNDFAELADAVENSTDPLNTINIMPQLITSTGSFSITSQMIDFNFLQNDSVFDFDNNENCIFINNSSVTFNSGGTAFQNGYSSGNGGILNVSAGSNITFTGATTFSDSSAGASGGAIFADGSTVSFSGEVTFSSNSATTSSIDNGGGAVYAQSSSSINFSNAATFHNNNSTYRGGAIFSSYSYIAFDKQAIFSSNETNPAGLGGAIYIIASSITFNDATSFSSNTASLGGAIYTTASSITFNAEAIFSSNTAGHGAALFINDGSNTVTFSKAATFSSNTANGYGGAIYNSASPITFNGAAAFSSNFGTNGGAIYANSGSIITFNDTADFSGNTSTGPTYLYGGGAIYTVFSNITFTRAATFSKNAAVTGGAIYATNGNITFNEAVLFSSNTSSGYGGAIYNNAAQITITTATFTGNTAAGGNDIYQTSLGTTTFTTGSSYFSGGIEGLGLFKITDNANVYFQTGSKNNIAGTFSIESGNLNLSTTTYINSVIISAAGGLGITTDFTHTGTSELQTDSIIIDADSKLAVSGAAPGFSENNKKIVTGMQSVAILRTNAYNLAFSSQNIIGGNYKFEWTAASGDYDYTGWLIYGSSTPWNMFADYYQTAAAEDEIVLEMNIKASDGDEDPFSTTAGTNFTINGNGFTVDSDNREGKYFNIAGSSLTIKDITFTNFINTLAGSGGVIYSSYSNINFAGNVIFSSNSANRGGGFYALESSVTFKENAAFTDNEALSGGALFANNADISLGRTGAGQQFLFSGNKAGQDGGAVAAANNSVLTFNTETIFNSNKALGNNGGAVFASTGSNVSFNDISSFSGNTADLYGGALYSSYGAGIIFNSSAAFSGNSAYAGGAAAAENADITFNNMAAFSGNMANAGGAVLAMDGSRILFTGDTLFSSNSASSGGAVASVENSAVTFDGTAEFIGNIATYSSYNGGGVFAAEESTVSFNSASFISNSARRGGGAYLTDNSFLYAAFSIDFSSNSARDDGGAVYADRGSNVLFDAKTAFLNNSAVNGGAFFAAGSTGTFNGETTFSSNSATNGGAVYAYDNSRVILDGAEFYGNSASELGGAIFLSNASLVLNAGNNLFVFENNTANGEANDIYAISSTVTFNAQNYDITLDSGIKDDGQYTNNFYKTGAHNLYLNGINNFTADIFEISEGTFVLGKRDDSEIAINDLLIQNAGTLDILNGSQENFDFGSITLNGKLKMDADDKINVENAEMNGELLISFEKLRPAQSGIYALINSLNSFTGSGVSLSTEGVNYNRIESITVYETDNQAGYEISIAELQNLSGLTDNQKETAKAIDRAFVYASGDSIADINFIDGLDDKTKKKTLDELSGSFIANVIKAGASNAGQKTLFRHIKRASGNKESSLWAYGYAGGISFGEDDNSYGDFSGNGFGAMAGWNVYSESDASIGIYINYEGNSYEQEDNSADMDSFVFGLYGGLFRGNWTFKGMVSGGLQDYKTERKISVLNAKAKGDFGASAFAAAVIAEYAITVNQKITLNPYGKLEFDTLSYGNYKEKNAAAALNMQSGSYVNGQFSAGARAEGILSERMNWNAGAGIGFLFTGKNGEFDAKIYGEEITVKGAEQGSISAELSVGADYKITEKISAYADIIFAAASDMNEYTGRAGLSYKLGK